MGYDLNERTRRYDFVMASRHDFILDTFFFNFPIFIFVCPGGLSLRFLSVLFVISVDEEFYVGVKEIINQSIFHC